MRHAPGDAGLAIEVVIRGEPADTGRLARHLARMILREHDASRRSAGSPGCGEVRRGGRNESVPTSPPELTT